MRAALLALVAVAATAVAFAEDDPAKRDLKALVGTWQYTSQEADGKATDREDLKAVTIRDLHHYGIIDCPGAGTGSVAGLKCRYEPGAVLANQDEQRDSKEYSAYHGRSSLELQSDRAVGAASQVRASMAIGDSSVSGKPDRMAVWPVRCMGRLLLSHLHL